MIYADAVNTCRSCGDDHLMGFEMATDEECRPCYESDTATFL